MRLANKVVVVTGAGSGIGRQLSLELVKRGARVAAVDLNGQAARETAGLSDEAVSPFALDITDRAAVEALPGEVVRRFGAVDGLVNNAGIIQPFVRLTELDYRTIDRVFEVNFRGTLYLTKAFLPLLLERPEAHLVNVSSMGGFLPVPGQSIYGASKAAVKLLTESLYAELADTRVRVTVVFPGAIDTHIAENSGVAAPPATEAQRASVYPAELAARDILDGVEKNRFRVLVGKDAKMLDVMYRLNPRRATRFIAQQMKSLLAPLTPR